MLILGDPKSKTYFNKKKSLNLLVNKEEADMKKVEKSFRDVEKIRNKFELRSQGSNQSRNKINDDINKFLKLQQEKTLAYLRKLGQECFDTLPHEVKNLILDLEKRKQHVA